MSKYPNIKVKLTGIDGNALMILGVVLKAMRERGLDKTTRDEFIEEAKSGDYRHLLMTCMKWVDVS